MTDFSLDKLKKIKMGQPLPEMAAMREWLKDTYGFTEIDFNLYPPGSRTSIYMPGHFPTMDRKTLNAIITALEVIEEARGPVAAVPVPAELQAIVDNYPEFTAQMDGEFLRVASKEYPEFDFKIPCKSSMQLSTIASSLTLYLDQYSNADNDTSLPNYAKTLKAAEEYGLKREVKDGKAVLVSLVNDMPDLRLREDNALIIPKIEHQMEIAATDVATQLDFMDSLGKNYGFHSVDNDVEEGKLRLMHKNHPGMAEFPIHGEMGYMLKWDFEHLKEFAEKLKIIEPERPKVQRIQVAAPKSDDTLLVLDAGVLFNLSNPINGDEETSWFALLNETKKLQGIGKIIIPDYIADVELRNKVCAYNSDGEPEFINLTATQKQQPAAFQEFMKNAVRRHVKENGEVEYLAEPGATGNGGKIIIWETNEGRKRAVELANAAAAGARYTYREPNFGEKQITQLLAQELDWDNPVNVITTDLKYMYKENPPKETPFGQKISYDTTHDYLEAELSARPEELHEKHGIDNDVDKHYRRMMVEMNATNDTLLKAHVGGDDEATGIRGLIANCVAKTRAAKAAPKETAPATPAVKPAPARIETVAPQPAKIEFAKVEQVSFGGFLKEHLKGSPEATASAVKQILAERDNIKSKTITKKIHGEGRKPPRSDVLYYLIEQMDSYARKQGASELPSHKLFQRPHLSHEALASDVQTMLDAFGTEGSEAILAATTKTVNSANGQSPALDATTIGEFLEGKVPQTNIAAALRDILQKTNGGTQEFDRTYFAARAEQARAFAARSQHLK